MKVALVYDRVNKWGGAEKALLALHRMFPNAPLYTSVCNLRTAPWAKIFPQAIPSFLQNIPILKNYHELLGWLTPIAYETFNFDEYDLVISVTSEAAKGIITKPSTLHVCYCLTPTRYLWSGYNEYLNNPPRVFKWIPFYKLVAQPFLNYVKSWDLVASQRPDVMIAISKEVKNRLKMYYKRDSEVVYPPVDVDRFRILKSKVVSTKRAYFLVVARLVPYKKVDLVIKTFNQLGLPLVIVGTGSEEGALKRMAKPNIKFVGFVNDKDLSGYYHGAQALVMPQEEDFGIVSVEAQASGTPVIAFRKGGALDTVIEGKTGLFFDSQTSESLEKALNKFIMKKGIFTAKECVTNAERFSEETFKKEFKKLIEML